MMLLATADIADLRRWLISGAIVVLAHGAIAAAIVTWREEIEPAEPAAAIVVEFAPLPVAPANQEMDIAPGPEQVMSDASPDRPIEKPVEETPPEVKPAPNPEVPIQPPQEVQQETPQEPRPPAPTTSAPQAAPLETAAIPAAPVQGQATPKSSNAIPTWKTQIVALLERNKRYPPAAHSRGEHGVAQVFFSLDRQGRVIESRVVLSSGALALDQEALALLHRAQPFPPPPAEMAGPRVDLMVPIRFNLK
jgi:protein TonB